MVFDTTQKTAMVALWCAAPNADLGDMYFGVAIGMRKKIMPKRKTSTRRRTPRGSSQPERDFIIKRSFAIQHHQHMTQ
jgi:hypothetical protein